MRLYGSIERQDLLKHLAEQYAFCKKIQYRMEHGPKQSHTMPEAKRKLAEEAVGIFRIRAGVYQLLIWNLRDYAF